MNVVSTAPRRSIAMRRIIAMCGAGMLSIGLASRISFDAAIYGLQHGENGSLFASIAMAMLAVSLGAGAATYCVRWSRED